MVRLSVMQKWIIFLAIFTATISANSREVFVEVEVEPEEETVIWVGPGWYDGVWFDNEVEFNDYHRYHHHDHDHDHGGGHHH